MKVRRSFGVLVAVSVAVVVTACGARTSSSVSDSTISPASVVPSDAVLYLDATIKPSSTELATIKQVVDRAAGAGTADKLLAQLKQAMAKPDKGGSFNKDVAPWLGQQVGFVITKLPSSLASSHSGTGSSAIEPYIAVILPTAHPDLAKNSLPALQQELSGKMIAEVSGNDVLIGGKLAVDAIASTSLGDSLAANNTYQADLAKLEPNPIAVAYENLRSLTALLRGELKSSPGGAALLNGFPSGVASSAMAGLTLTSDSVRLDIASSGGGAAPAQPADVSGLPGDSWLAVSTASISAAKLKSLESAFSSLAALGIASSSSSSSASATTASAFGSSSSSETVTPTSAAAQQADPGPGPASGTGSSYRGSSSSSTTFVSSSKPTNSASQAMGALGMLSPLFKSGLGPIHFAVAGTSQKTLRAGLSLTEKSSADVQQFEQLIYTFAQLGKAKLSGSPPSFSIAINKHLKVDVGADGDQAVATLGYPNAAAFTSPSSTLANNSVFQQATSQLPSGSHASVFVNLQTLANVAAADSSGRQAAKVLKRFSYVVVGGTPGIGRIVLGLR